MCMFGVLGLSCETPGSELWDSIAQHLPHVHDPPQHVRLVVAAEQTSPPSMLA